MDYWEKDMQEKLNKMKINEKLVPIKLFEGKIWLRCVLKTCYQIWRLKKNVRDKKYKNMKVEKKSTKTCLAEKTLNNILFRKLCLKYSASTILNCRALGSNFPV